MPVDVPADGPVRRLRVRGRRRRRQSRRAERPRWREATPATRTRASQTKGIAKVGRRLRTTRKRPAASLQAEFGPTKPKGFANIAIWGTSRGGGLPHPADPHGMTRSPEIADTLDDSEEARTGATSFRKQWSGPAASAPGTPCTSAKLLSCAPRCRSPRRQHGQRRSTGACKLSYLQPLTVVAATVDRLLTVLDYVRGA